MSLKIYENLFTGPFNLSEYIYRKNKKKSLIIFVEKSGKNYAPNFYCIDIIKTNEQDFIAIEYYNEKLKSLFSKTVTPKVFIKEYKDSELDKRENLYLKIKSNLEKERKLSMQY